MKKEIAVVSIWSLLQATPFIGWWPEIDYQSSIVNNCQQELPATITSTTNHVEIIKANKKNEKEKKALKSFETLIGKLEEEPKVGGTTDSSQLGLVMMSMAGTILISR